jgi:hypothetical protein
MTKDQEELADRIAKRCGRYDANEGHAQREAWHVVDQSYNLGIVDARGMVDVSGEIARRFRLSYVRAYRAECAQLPAGHY